MSCTLSAATPDEDPLGIFSAIMDKLLHHPTAAAAPAALSPPPQPAAPAAVSAQAQPATPSQAAAAPSQTVQPAPAPAQAVDVEAVLTQMASQKGGGNWRSSIVDLLKLLDLDSSLEARRQ